MRWIVPPALRVVEYAGILWVAALAGPSRCPPRSRCCWRSPSATTTSSTGCASAASRRRAGSTARAGGWDGRLLAGLRARRRGARPGRLLRRRDRARGRVRRRGVHSWLDVRAHPAARGLRGRGGGRGVIGMVLAAGAGRRLAPYTDTLPKTLVPVDGDRTILDIALGEPQGGRARRRRRRHGLRRRRGRGAQGRARGAPRRHARARLQRQGRGSGTTPTRCGARATCSAQGVLLVNGDTVHPPSVEDDAARRPRPGHPARARRRQAARRGGDEGPRLRRRAG